MQLTIHLPNMAKGAEVFNALGIFNNGETYEIDDNQVLASGILGDAEEVPATLVIGDTSVELVTVADAEVVAPVEPVQEPVVDTTDENHEGGDN